MTPSKFDNLAEKIGATQRSANSYNAPCPAHKDENPSLSLTLTDSGKLLVYCHSGCSYPAVMTAFRERGLLLEKKEQPQLFPTITSKDAEQGQKDKEQYIQDLGAKSIPVKGTVGEIYMQRRTGGKLREIPPTIRFISKLKHALSGQYFPCLILAFTKYPDKKITGVLRIYLAPDGSAKASVENPKLMFGSCKGAAIRLAAAGDELILCEGVEDGLTLMLALNKPVWVAGSSTLLEHIILPDLPLASTVYLAQDNDWAGEQAIKKLGNRLYAEGRLVKITKPPKAFKDFNQIVQNQTLNASRIQQNHPTEERNRDDF